MIGKSRLEMLSKRAGVGERPVSMFLLNGSRRSGVKSYESIASRVPHVIGAGYRDRPTVELRLFYRQYIYKVCFPYL